MALDKENYLLQWETNSKELTKTEMRAIELKYEGGRYEDLSKLLKQEFPEYVYSLDAVNLRQWFYEKGKLRPAYDAYRGLMRQEAIERAKTLLDESVELATRTTIALMAGRYNADARLKASREILNRILGTPAQNIKIDDEDRAENKQTKDKLNELIKYVKDTTSNIRPEAEADASGDSEPVQP
jgi:hypothetical protein